MVSASPPCAAPNSISAFVAPKTENQVPGGGLCRLRRISILRSTRQDAQIYYLSTLSIFIKQTTYLATLPNPKSEEKQLEPSHFSASCGHIFGHDRRATPALGSGKIEAHHHRDSSRQDETETALSHLQARSKQLVDTRCGGICTA